jgi:hypothetical protein
MNFKEAMTSLGEVKQYFLDLIVELSDGNICMKNDKFGIMVLNAYCALEMAHKPFQPLDDIICFEGND